MATSCKELVTTVLFCPFGLPCHKTIIYLTYPTNKHGIYRNQFLIANEQAVTLLDIIYLNTLFPPPLYTSYSYREIAFVISLKGEKGVGALLKEFAYKQQEN